MRYWLTIIQAWDNYRTQLRYAQDADEKAAMYLRRATGQ